MKKYQGFTIVELLIVIVVIGILAALVLSSFAGAQAKARDTDRRNDLSVIKRALLAYEIDNGNTIGAGSGCGYAGNGSGWFNYDYDGAATSYKSMVQCLVDGKYLQQEVLDPTGAKTCSGLSCRTYIKMSCADGSTYLYANLETLSQNGTEADGTCYPTYDTDYGMNYIVRVK